MNLLIVDGNPERRKVVERRACKAVVSSTVSVATVAQAMAKIKSEQWHTAVIAWDIEEEELGNGSLLIVHLHWVQPECWIICLSSDPDPEGELGSQAYDCGADDFISTNWGRSIDSYKLMEMKLKIQRKRESFPLRCHGSSEDA